MDLEHVARAGLARVVRGFLISTGICSLAFVPVMVFTFIGLAGSPNIRETNSLFAGLIQAHGLVPGLLLAFLSNILPATVVLGFVHLLFYRPFVFYDPQHMAFARKLIAAGGALFLLVWGQRFFLDAYNDMRVLVFAQISSSEFLWGILLLCLCFFTAGLVYWGMTLTPGFRAREGTEKKDGGEPD